MTKRIGMHDLATGLIELGYTYREKERDYILCDINGRYHVKPEQQVAALHYDLQGPSGMHITNIPMPIHLNKEYVRIQRYESKHAQQRVDIKKKLKENNTMEYKPFDLEKGTQAMRLLIEASGDDPNRDGLRETPERAAKFWSQVIDYTIDPKKYLKLFEMEPNDDDDVVYVEGPLYSFCEHHMALFRGKVSIAYIPKDKIIGISKLIRIARVFAKRWQVQERLQKQIASFLSENLSPDVMVHVAAEHTCMTVRGARTPESKTRTASKRGRFKTESEFRNEFWQYVNQSANGK